MTTLDIIIVNWNTGGQLADCLRSLRETDTTGIEIGRVAVIDNCSSDGSVRDLDLSELPALLTVNPTNRGFAAACNQGARDSRADYLLFLNPDMILYKDSIAVPIAFLEQNSLDRIGIAGIQLVDGRRRISRTCARFPRPEDLMARALGLDRLDRRGKIGYILKGWDHRHSGPVDHVIGAFYLVRRELFERLGGFDERFFVYLEDLDFSRRAAAAGYRSYYLASARAFHRGGGASDGDRPRRLFYALRSRILYAFKHFGRGPASLVAFCTLVIEPWIRLITALLSCSAIRLGETCRGYKLLWSNMPSILKGKGKNA